MAAGSGVGPGPPRASAAELQLQDAAARLARAPAGWSALVLHLSRLRPPAPRPHHRRVARVLLEEAGRRHDGQVFAMRNGDLVLLCHGALPRSGGETLAETMARLLRADAPAPEAVMSVWGRADHGPALLDYATARLADGAAAPPLPAAPVPAAPARADCIEAVVALAGGGRILDLLRRRDGILLAALRAARGQGGVLDPAGGARLHVALSLATVLAEGFVADAAEMALGVEIPLIDAAADPAGFAVARRHLAAAGLPLVLGGVSPPALALVDPGVLGADLVKLDWSPAMPAAVARAVARLGPERVLLDRAESEAALRWGLARGIRRFQGAHVEAMLAAGRLAACAAARHCTWRQCRERAAIVGAAGRGGCGNPALLAAGAP